jgi:DNA-binding GntR family transcriptional regulator
MASQPAMVSKIPVAHFGSNSTHHTLAERVRQEIAQRIREGRYRAGDRIGQEELASEYGTSRLPIREALRQLASEGLITVQPHAGARVARLDLAELEEVYLIRERIDPLAVARCVPNLSDEDLTALELLVVQMETLSSLPSRLQPMARTRLGNGSSLTEYST